jgi:hypothetical protein
LIRNLDRLLEASGNTREAAATPARERAPDIAVPPERSTPRRSPMPDPGGGAADRGAGPSASVAARMRAPAGEDTRPTPDLGAPREPKPSRQFPAPTNIGPLLILPGIVIILYFILYITGIWKLGQTSLYAPAHPLAQAGLFWFCMARYGRAGALRSLLGAAAVWCASSALSVASGLATSTMSDIPPSSRAPYIALVGVIGAVLFAAAVMAIGAYLCPVLKRRRYWVIALIGYPLLTLVFSTALPALIASSIERSSMPGLLFAALAVRQVALFACLGHWVSQPFRAAASASGA